MKNNPLRQNYDKLNNKQDFLPLLKYFIHTSIAEEYSVQSKTKDDDISYSQFYEKFVDSVFSMNVENVFKYCHSPIERIFLNSFMLLFLKNRMPCLFITSPFNDTETDIADFRIHYKKVDHFIETYKTATNDVDLLNFDQRLREKEKEGKLSSDDVEDILMYENLRKEFEFNSYHITPQAAFPNFKVDNKSIRADFFIWVPNDPNIKIIVECDGFQFHNNKTSFINDKVRDRLFQLNGYRVIRYSGSEIYQDPIKVSSDLFDLLEAIDEDKENLRVK